ncbi:phage major capsid protein, P2 family [Pandoraea cepalis]|uniref:Phage major capsid protein, P2 family n=1 Tax=Pandoraea cepalis TaxID=2508294 RepID=A0AAW7MJ52_9BURK|nr:phage major capsid protein, P2 family [Pandoraea cepalis]MDN4572666.1 phage major capsid protein, P2 family [Pandoraea cepalis]MDN4577081.1 phage major capsid protein, P2 family [Pandoraea cepalis]
MRNETRVKFNAYTSQIAQLNGVKDTAVKFTVAPSVQQNLEGKIQESSDFLGKINVFGVDEQEGEKVGVGVSGPIASTTDTTTKERQTTDVSALDSNRYRCEQTNYDTHIRYAQLDAWAGKPEFQTLLRDGIIKRQALDRIMVGFNGVKRSPTSDRVAYPMLQDVNKGWLQQFRENAPAQVMAEVVEGSGKIVIGKGGDYENIDALVFDLVNTLIAPWYAEDPELVVICGRKLMADKYFPIVNQSQPNTESLAADLIISQKRIGNLPAVRVPFFPANGLLVTKLSNLSLYWQKDARRRTIREEPKRDRIENYESSNDAYVVEDYLAGAVAENIELKAA